MAQHPRFASACPYVCSASRYALSLQHSFDATTDLRAGFPRFTPANLVANRPIVEFLTKFGANKGGATPAQLSLAWLLAQNPWIVPIPGTRNVDHLNENLGASLVHLTPDDVRDIDAALAAIKAYGGRMNATQMAQIGVD